MAATETRIAPDSATDLRDLIGDDATATFESDRTFIESDPTGSASSNNVAVQRDTDDLEDSEEEEDEDDLEDEDEYDDDEEEEDEEYEDEDEDEDEDLDDDDDDGVTTMAARSGVERGASATSNPEISEESLLERDDAEDEDEDDSDPASMDRVVDAALRMHALVAVVAEFAASI